MHQTSSPSLPPVVVGIDGSESAIRAAEWAAAEAVNRGVPLRLVHVIEPGSEAVRLEAEYAEIALRAARDAITAPGRRLEVEAVVVHGDISAVLIEESRHAALMCVGSSGVDHPNRMPLGSAARDMARSAHWSIIEGDIEAIAVGITVKRRSSEYFSECLNDHLGERPT